MRSVYKQHDGELVERISPQSGHPLAKWTGSTLTYLHALALPGLFRLHSIRWIE